MIIGYDRGIEDGNISGIYAAKIYYISEKKCPDSKISVLDIEIPTTHSFIHSHWYEYPICDYRKVGVVIEQAYHAIAIKPASQGGVAEPAVDQIIHAVE